MRADLPHARRSASSRTPTARPSSPVVRPSSLAARLRAHKIEHCPLTSFADLDRTARIHAFCGGLEKNADGTWTNGGVVTDYTRLVVKKSFSTTVKVKGAPISLKECLKFQKKHKK